MCEACQQTQLRRNLSPKPTPKNKGSRAVARINSDLQSNQISDFAHIMLEKNKKFNQGITSTGRGSHEPPSHQNSSNNLV